TRLEFIDRFRSTSADADQFEVLLSTSPYLASAVTGKRYGLHTHCGWFDFEARDIRQLTNVNIDVADIDVPPPPDAVRRIAILTMTQFEALNGEVLDRPIERLNALHDHLKAIFSDIITPEAAARVALDVQ